MKHGLRLEIWMAGCLVGASLAAGAYLAVRFDLGKILNPPPQVLAELPPLPTVQDPPATFRHKKRTARGNSSRTQMESPQASQLAVSDSAGREKIDPAIPTVPATIGALASVHPSEPESKTLKPIGYVQKAGGAVEAIVSDGDGVQVVHVGDAFQEKYSVARITPDGVEVVAVARQLSVPSSGVAVISASNLVSGTGSEAWTYSPPTSSQAREVHQIQPASVRGKLERTKDKVRVPPATELAASIRQPENRPAGSDRPAINSATPIGSVEKANGTKLAVIADGESVRLVQPGNTPAQADSGKQSPGIQTAKASDPAGSKNMTLDKGPQTWSGASGALGYVERSGGKLEAILDDGNGVRLSPVSNLESATLIALGSSAGPVLDAGPQTSRSGTPEIQGTRLSLNPGVPYSSPGNRRIFQENSTRVEDVQSAQGLSGEEKPQPGDSPGKLPPEVEVAQADERVIPQEPPPDIAKVESTLGFVTEAKGTSEREADILGSLGFTNPQGDRASPLAAPFEPAAPPTGPPDSETAVLRSFGYEEWQYGRGSPLALSLGLKTSGSHTGNPTYLKPLGYMEWQDGRALAVISDGAGGVCVVAEGDILDGRFRVGKISSEQIEIIELPTGQTSWAPDFLPGVEGNFSNRLGEPRPTSTAIAELPLAQTTSTQLLISALGRQITHARKVRPGRKAQALPTARPALGTSPVTEALPLAHPPEGRGNLQPSGHPSSAPALALTQMVSLVGPSQSMVPGLRVSVHPEVRRKGACSPPAA